jgi:hypothetical protein
MLPTGAVVSVPDIGEELSDTPISTRCFGVISLGISVVVTV